MITNDSDRQALTCDDGCCDYDGGGVMVWWTSWGDWGGGLFSCSAVVHACWCA